MFDADDAKNVAEKAAEGVSGAIKNLLSGQVTGKVRRFATEADIMVWLDRVNEADPRKSVFSGTPEEKGSP